MSTAVIIEMLRDRDLAVFRSFEEACSYLEAIDVENHEYAAFDPEGFPLALGVDGNRVTIERIPNATPNKEKIEKMLREYLGDDATSMSFDQVLLAAQRRSRGWLMRLIDFMRGTKNA